MGRDGYSQQSLGALHSRVKKARVLMVGAGGIGCELLKNLVLTGFGEIHVVDLDTIDLSNLNRQFLFRHEHIKKPKALVAKETAHRFNPHVKIEAYHANIMDSQFNIGWFKSFEIVFNALDNIAARSHVNKMCIAADVPLVESGTTGFQGQVQIIKKGVTRCYDCVPKEAPKSFPVCTIRSTPSQPIHCIVWGKSYLFTELFGISEEEVAELDFSEDSGNKEEIENLRKEAEALKNIRDAMSSPEFVRLVFDKVFKEDVERLLSMEDMWKNRRSPAALNFEQLLEEGKSIPATIADQGQSVWTVAENFAVFSDSLRRLACRILEMKSDAADNPNAGPMILTFDKDDVDTLDFVTASANLRSYIFGIPMRSKFDIKQMAGNIIPAIATTNASTAALCVLQAFKVMRDQAKKIPMVFTFNVNNGRVLLPELGRDGNQDPVPGCNTCSVARATVLVDPARATLGDLVDGVLREKLGYGEELQVLTEEGVIYEPDYTDSAIKTFAELNLNGENFITIQDDDEDAPKVNLIIAISAISDKTFTEDGQSIQLLEAPQIPQRPKSAPTEKSTAPTNGTTNVENGKRKRTASVAGLEQTPVSKKGKMPAKENGVDDLIVLDDTSGGIIILDDD
ncbi:ubiquitin-activating enzyme E1 3 [Venturia nashicola]|uniref:Ubiquitin-activating enzyme E1-like n=1 Tax=Venturia nashicola TaxID=86259 RepID=A0A4Z1PIE8_9PEZI|nr:ubiquitin-activating enzyme E1 [Venturia nashicola]TLD34949.1 ubiquitin-activating enzyme E1 3 [Venturia nashicola]